MAGETCYISSHTKYELFQIVISDKLSCIGLTFSVLTLAFVAGLQRGGRGKLNSNAKHGRTSRSNLTSSSLPIVRRPHRLLLLEPCSLGIIFHNEKFLISVAISVACVLGAPQERG